MPPEDGSTLWQGMTIGRGLQAQAVPTALYAPGCPDASAISLYVRVSPYGISDTASRTSLKKSVPENDRGRSNSILLPDRYSPI